MTKYKGLFTLLGFLLAGAGFLAIVLSMIGLKLSFLVWIDRPGPLIGFIIRLVMILAGVIIIYLAQTDFSGEKGTGEY